MDTDMGRSFGHSSDIWAQFPELVPGVLIAHGIDDQVDVSAALNRFGAVAETRLAASSEGEFPEIQAWRRAFSAMGLKPTQYRSAAESLLRRFRKEGALPPIHPLVDLCNAVSMAFAVPVAVLDTARIGARLVVRHAVGNEEYVAFSGAVERPETGEVIFADDDGRAHARRWTNRQSGYSAVRESTTDVLIVAEGLHESAAGDVPKLIAVLTDEIDAHWSVPAMSSVLSRVSPTLGY